MTMPDEAGFRERQPRIAQAAPPYWLLWAVAAAAAVLSIAAFGFWGRNGTVMLFDMMVALCF